MFTDSADAKRESMKIAIAGMGYVGLSGHVVGAA